MDIITAVRDILISVYLIAGIVLVLAMLIFAFLLYKATKGLLSVSTRAMKNFEEVSESAIEHISEPLKEGVSVGQVAGNMVGFATGFVAGMRGRKAEKKDEGKKRRRWIPFL